jgi:uncharacterized protein (TIGR03437 family)
MKTIISVFLASLCFAISALAQDGNGQTTAKFPNDPRVDEQGYLYSIGVRQTWTPTSGLASIQTPNVMLVVMDSGVTPSKELVVDILNSRTFFGNSSPTDDPGTKGFMSAYPHGHGTIMATIIGAQGNNGEDGAGINWHANVVSFKVYDLFEISPGVTVLTTKYEAVLNAFNALHGLSSGNIVVNCSFSLGEDPSDPDGNRWKEIIKSLGDKVLIVIAAGNNNGNTKAQYPCGFGLSNVICVGSTGKDNKLYQFSSRGDFVEITAPGEGIASTASDGTFPSVDGMSASVTMVSGIASLLWQGKPTLKSSELKQVILSGASFNPSLIGLVTGARQLNFQGSIKALENLTDGITNTTPQVSLLGIGSVWTDQPGLAWGGLASAYGNNFTDGAEFISETPQTRLGNVSVFIGEIPMPLTYVGPHQINFQYPEDNFQFHQGDNNTSVVRYGGSDNVLSWSAIQGVRPVAYNPGFLTGMDGKLFLDTLDGETVIYAVGLGFTDPWVKAGKVGAGTEKVQATVLVNVDSVPIFQCKAVASSRWAGVYEIRIPAVSENAKSLIIRVGEWQKKFLLK